MKNLSYKTVNINNALFHEGEGDILIVWFDGGYGQQPELYSLGKLINSGKLNPKYPILIPRASYGHNTQNITATELNDLINLTGYKRVSICGWSNGSDATCLQVAAQPSKFERICLISNYSNQWKNCYSEITGEVNILLGAREKSAAKNRSWPIVDQLNSCKIYRVQPYDHMIGEAIWTDHNYFVLDWLVKRTDDIQKAPKQIEQTKQIEQAENIAEERKFIKASKQVFYNENIEAKRRIK